MLGVRSRSNARNGSDGWWPFVLFALLMSGGAVCALPGSRDATASRRYGGLAPSHPSLAAVRSPRLTRDASGPDGREYSTIRPSRRVLM